MKHTEHPMGTRPVLPLLVSMSLPAITSMLIQSLYNVVDSIFVARVSNDALTAVSLAYPLQNMVLAVAVGFGVGANAYIARNLGEGNQRNVDRAASMGMVFTTIHAVIFLLIGLLGSDPFLGMFTNDPEILRMSSSYTRIVICLSFGSLYHIYIEKLFQAVGNMFVPMILQGVGAIVNIVLDPIMIFGLLGFPKMGVAGAALATVTGQIIALILGFVLNTTRNHEIHLAFKGFRPEKEIIGHIYAVGIPSIIMASIGSVMTFGMNKILIAFTSTATAVFGVYFKLQSFVFMPVFGLNNGTVPIIAYNFGAGRPDRIVKTLKLSIAYAVSIMIAGLLLFNLAAENLLMIFNASDSMLEIGVPALKIISLSFILAGFGIACSSLFQAMGHGMLSLWVSVLRQLVILLPAAFLFAKTLGLSYVWFAFPLAEVFSAGISAVFLRHVYKKEILPLKQSFSREK